MALDKLPKLNISTNKILLLSIPFLLLISILSILIICTSPLIFIYFIYKETSDFIQNYDRRKKQLLMFQQKQSNDKKIKFL